MDFGHYSMRVIELHAAHGSAIKLLEELEKSMTVHRGRCPVTNDNAIY